MWIATRQFKTCYGSISYLGPTRPRRPAPQRTYARPVLPSKPTHTGPPDRGSLGPTRDIAALSGNLETGVACVCMPAKRAYRVLPISTASDRPVGRPTYQPRP